MVLLGNPISGKSKNNRSFTLIIIRQGDLSYGRSETSYQSYLVDSWQVTLIAKLWALLFGPILPILSINNCCACFWDLWSFHSTLSKPNVFVAWACLCS